MDIQELLALSVTKGASDLHIIPNSEPLLRIYGKLSKLVESPALTPEFTKELIYSLLAPEQREAFEKNFIIELGVKIEDVGNFRMSAFHQSNGLAAIFRVIPTAPPSFEKLGLPAVFKRLLVLTQGLILLTGPTGSGKSTTLAALIESMNATRHLNIITIEDPIEFTYTNKKSSINQIQVYRDTVSINKALRAALRQDPDVILIGELRDLETIQLALTAAETGHLVLATLHASSAPLAINRVIDIFPDIEKNRIRNLLSENLQAVIYQTLLEKSTGGRVAAFEIMLANNAVRHQIRQDKMAQLPMTMQTSGDLGMCSLEQYMDKLLTSGVVTPQVVRNAVMNRDLFTWE